MDLKKKVAYRAVIRLHRATSELVNRFLTLSYEYYIITLYKGKYTIKTLCQKRKRNRRNDYLYLYTVIQFIIYQ